MNRHSNIQQYKLLNTCGTDTQQYSKKNYDFFYLRKVILDTIKYDKPIIITGFIEMNPYDYYYSIREVKPYAPNCETTKPLCGHINLTKTIVDQYINLYDGFDYSNELFVFICRPYKYYDKDNEIRGGVRLTDELGITPVMFYEEALAEIKQHHLNQSLDWQHYCNGYYLGISNMLIVLEQESKKKMRQTHKYMKKQQKKQDQINLPFLNVKKNQPISLDYFFIKI